MCCVQLAWVPWDCAARAAVAQAAADVMDSRRGILTPVVQALDGPPMDPQMMMPMAPMMAPMAAPMAAMAPAVQVGLRATPEKQHIRSIGVPSM